MRTAPNAIRGLLGCTQEFRCDFPRTLLLLGVMLFGCYCRLCRAVGRRVVCTQSATTIKTDRDQLLECRGWLVTSSEEGFVEKVRNWQHYRSDDKIWSFIMFCSHIWGHVEKVFLYFGTRSSGGYRRCGIFQDFCKMHIAPLKK